jgi:NAD(P) transhydrogenase subunit beta
MSGSGTDLALLTVAYLVVGRPVHPEPGGLSKPGDGAARQRLTASSAWPLVVVATTLCGGSQAAYAMLLGARSSSARPSALCWRPRRDDRHARARRVLHSFVGARGRARGLSPAIWTPHGPRAVHRRGLHLIEIWSASRSARSPFTGSIVAWASCAARISGKPLLLPGRHMLNLALVVGIAYLGGAVRAGAGGRRAAVAARS